MLMDLSLWSQGILLLAAWAHTVRPYSQGQHLLYCRSLLSVPCWLNINWLLLVYCGHLWNCFNTECIVFPFSRCWVISWVFKMQKINFLAAQCHHPWLNSVSKSSEAEEKDTVWLRKTRLKSCIILSYLHTSQSFSLHRCFFDFHFQQNAHVGKHSILMHR